MAPACTSSNRTNPGRIGSPAASAEVHPSGRSAFERVSHLAPAPAVQPLLDERAWYSSNSVQVPVSKPMACPSEPDSTGALRGIGAGPGSLSSPYSSYVTG